MKPHQGAFPFSKDFAHMETKACHNPQAGQDGLAAWSTSRADCEMKSTAASCPREPWEGAVCSGSSAASRGWVLGNSQETYRLRWGLPEAPWPSGVVLIYVTLIGNFSCLGGYGPKSGEVLWKQQA